MSKQLAIIKEVGYGNRDLGRPCLFFTTYIDEHAAALQVLVGEKADEAIRVSGVYEVKDLNGKACWVEVDGGRIEFLGVAKI